MVASAAAAAGEEEVSTSYEDSGSRMRMISGPSEKLLVAAITAGFGALTESLKESSGIFL